MLTIDKFKKNKMSQKVINKLNIWKDNKAKSDGNFILNKDYFITRYLKSLLIF